MRSRLAAPSSTTWVRKPKNAAAGSSASAKARASSGQRRQPLQQDGLAELLLGREVAVERAHPDAGLLGDQVDGDLDPLDGEDGLGGFEDAGPVALGVGPQRARAPAAAASSHPASTFEVGSTKSLLPRLTNGTQVPYSVSGTRTPIPIVSHLSRENQTLPGQGGGAGAIGTDLVGHGDHHDLDPRPPTTRRPDQGPASTPSASGPWPSSPWPSSWWCSTPRW